MQNNNDILVSVYMASYNHEDYVEKALLSVIKQKTNFKVQIIVHDDASTDETQNIIKKIDALYPGRLFCIFQKENQYSKGVPIFKTFVKPLIKGKYFIACECDDYWCDLNKLQKQVDFLESNPHFVCCTHNCKTVDENDKEIDIRSLQVVKCKEHVYKRKCFEYLAYFPGPTAAKLYRASVLKKYGDDFYNGFYSIKTQGDVRTNFLLSLEGPIFYMSDIMSVYRRVSSHGDSWSARYKDVNLNDRRFISSIQMRRFAKRFYGIHYKNYYLTFNAAIRAFILFFKNKNEANKTVLQNIIRQKKNMFCLLLYLFLISFIAIPLYLIRTALRKRVLLKNGTD